MHALRRLLPVCVLLLAPTLAYGQRCVVDVVVMNLDRSVSGPVSVECSGPFHSIPFGNWGAEFRYLGEHRLRDGYQFSGWKTDDGWLQWNSCTTRFPSPDPQYYNDRGHTTQVAMPNVVNVVESRRDHTLTGIDGVACEDLRTNPIIEFGYSVSSVGLIELEVYELDRRILIDGPDHVATLLYGPIAVPYSCDGEWSCRGESVWVRPVSGDERVSARLKLEVYLREEEREEE